MLNAQSRAWLSPATGHFRERNVKSVRTIGIVERGLSYKRFLNALRGSRTERERGGGRGEGRGTTRYVDFGSSQSDEVAL